MILVSDLTPNNFTESKKWSEIVNAGGPFIYKWQGATALYLMRMDWKPGEKPVALMCQCPAFFYHLECEHRIAANEQIAQWWDEVFVKFTAEELFDRL